MPILPSSAADVGRLIAELSSGDALRRETATARLAVIGARAITRLGGLAADASASVPARIAALQALEAIGDPRSLAGALALAEEDGDLGTAAIALIGSVAKSGGTRATRAFEWLAALVLDQEAPEARRLAALAALEGGSARHLRPVYAALATDPSARLASRATRRAAGDVVSIEAALDRGLSSDPALVIAMIRDEAETATLTVLRRLLDGVRDREGAASGDARAAWAAARGLVHQALGVRGSRLGVYDLRETLQHAVGPLPVGFLAAAAAVGDTACLEPLAAAWADASAADRWWRDHLAEAFRAIVRREALTRRHPALKRILERLPAAAVLVAAARK